MDDTGLLAAIREMVREVIREELDRYQVKRRPPEDISQKRRAAARVMLAKRAERANAEQMLKPKKVNGHAHPRANAEQMLGDGDIVATIDGLKGEVKVGRSFCMELIEAYPAVMVAQEIDRAKLWLAANPTKRKSNVRKFLTNWMARCQERGGSK